MSIKPHWSFDRRILSFKRLCVGLLSYFFNESQDVDTEPTANFQNKRFSAILIFSAGTSQLN